MRATWRTRGLSADADAGRGRALRVPRLNGHTCARDVPGEFRAALSAVRCGVPHSLTSDLVAARGTPVARLSGLPVRMGQTKDEWRGSRAEWGPVMGLDITRHVRKRERET